MRRATTFWIVALGLLIDAMFVASVHAQPIAKLKPQTLKAYETYLKVVEESTSEELVAGWYWIQQQPRSRQLQVRQGEVILEKFEEDVEIPGGIVHLWVGAAFIRNARADRVVALLLDYDQYASVYPEVEESRNLARRGDLMRGYLRLSKEMVFKVVFNMEYEVRSHLVVPGKLWFIQADAVKIEEVRDAGETDEEVLPFGEDSGFVWGIRNYWRVEQLDNGVMLECNVISLSRGFPWGLGWIVKPYAERAAKEVRSSLLESTRKAFSSSSAEEITMNLG